MNKIKVSAPGKLMLLGEHAVVYNRPCLVTAVDQRMKLSAEVLNIQEFQLDAYDVNITGYRKSIKDLCKGDIPKGAKFVEFALKNIIDYIDERHAEFISASSKKQSNQGRSRNEFGMTNKIGFKITTNSEFSSQFGFGSSSSSTVCTVKAVSELLNLKLSQREMFDLAYKTVLDVQGKGSGFDVAAGIYGGTLHFVTGGEFIEKLNISELPLIVGYSGIKSDTVTIVNHVKSLAEKYPETIEEIYNSIEDLVLFAKQALLESNWESLGQLMDFNQGYLEALGVGMKKLADMIYSARDAGAYGAKISGSGKGDCMIAIAPEDKRKAVEDAITQAGGEIIQAKTNAEGVRIEK